MDLNADMLRGHIDTIILLSLTDGDKDTNEIRRQIEEKSENRYSVKQGTFYSAMQRLTKQQLIKEYRSSSNDGIRRKYFSLTEKGTAFVENNRQEWQKSKALLDTLIEDDVKVQQEDSTLTGNDFPIPPADNFLNGKEDTTSNDAVDAENNYQEDIIQENKASQISVEFTKSEKTYSVDNGYSVSDNNIISDKVNEQKSEALNNQQLKKTEKKVYPFEIKDSDLYMENETDFEPTVEITVQHDDKLNNESLNNIDEPVITDESDLIDNSHEFINDSEPENLVTNETNINEQKTVYADKIENFSSIDNNEENDLLSFENGAFANRREYKSILSNLFPKDKESNLSSDNNDIKSENESENYYTNNDLNDFNTNENLFNNYKESTNENFNAYAPKENVNIDNSKSVYPHSDITDFSDLYAMAKREGFKIKTSYNTNKLNSDKILINKLNCHSALLFFVILFAEMLILNLCLGSIVNWAMNIKLIIVGIAAMFPLIMFLIYAINHARSIKTIATFKDVIEIALIITFQLTIIILCVALFASIDFGDVKSVTEYILLPFILSLNIPIYFIIKYALLSTGKYFDLKK